MKKHLYIFAFIFSASTFLKCSTSSNSLDAVDPMSPQPRTMSTAGDFVQSSDELLATYIGEVDDSIIVLPPLSAGQTYLPNQNYSVTDPNKPGYQEPHNTRVSDPYYLIKPHLSPQVPVNLEPHSRLVLTDVEDRTFFDYFAWQTFIGLVWPADPNDRGVPDPSVTVDDFKNFNTTSGNGNRVPVVWESFRTFDDCFPNNAECLTTPPKKWDADKYERPFNLDLFSKGQKGQSGSFDEAFSRPLVDQNREYVRYNLQLNEVMYDFIIENKWYLKENLPKSPTPATLPPLPVDTSTGKIIEIQQPQTNTIIRQKIYGNSITIKSAWRLMITKEDAKGFPYKQIDDLSRYFVSEAYIQDPVTNIVYKRKVGLVGLHIVVKTPQFTQGIWSSFEHVDNLDVSNTPEVERASFNSGKTGFQKQGFSYKPAQIAANGAGAVEEAFRYPVEVSRIYKIPDTPVGTSETLPDGLSTAGLNAAYKKKLKGTVWENYQLVITQWPTDPTSFYAKPFLSPRGPRPAADQPYAVQEAYRRSQQQADNAYPRWSGLPIPQTGCLNTTMETYFQNPDASGPDFTPPSLESTSCMGCHYSASDTDYSWAFKLRTYPQSYDQGRINILDTQKLARPANTGN